MEDILKAGANPSTADFNKVIPLHSAASQGSVEVCRILLRYGAATGAMDSMTGMMPLEWAERSCKNNVVFLLKAASAQDWGVDSCTPDSSSCGQSTPERSSSAPSTASHMTAVFETTEKKAIIVWKPVLGFFPDYYERRSGLGSSVILGFAIGQKVTTLHSHQPDFTGGTEHDEPYW